MEETFIEEKFESVLREAYDRLPEISYEDIDGLKKIINLLEKAQTYQRQ